MSVLLFVEKVVKLSGPATHVSYGEGSLAITYPYNTDGVTDQQLDGALSESAFEGEPSCDMVILAETTALS